MDGGVGAGQVGGGVDAGDGRGAVQVDHHGVGGRAAVGGVGGGQDVGAPVFRGGDGRIHWPGQRAVRGSPDVVDAGDGAAGTELEAAVPARQRGVRAGEGHGVGVVVDDGHGIRARAAVVHVADGEDVGAGGAQGGAEGVGPAVKSPAQGGPVVGAVGGGRLAAVQDDGGVAAGQGGVGRGRQGRVRDVFGDRDGEGLGALRRLAGDGEDVGAGGVHGRHRGAGAGDDVAVRGRPGVGEGLGGGVGGGQDDLGAVAGAKVGGRQSNGGIKSGVAHRDGAIGDATAGVHDREGVGTGAIDEGIDGIGTTDEISVRRRPRVGDVRPRRGAVAGEDHGATATVHVLERIDRRHDAPGRLGYGNRHRIGAAAGRVGGDEGVLAGGVDRRRPGRLPGDDVAVRGLPAVGDARAGVTAPEGDVAAAAGDGGGGVRRSVHGRGRSVDLNGDRIHAAADGIGHRQGIRAGSVHDGRGAIRAGNEITARSRPGERRISAEAGARGVQRYRRVEASEHPRRGDLRGGFRIVFEDDGGGRRLATVRPHHRELVGPRLVHPRGEPLVRPHDVTVLRRPKIAEAAPARGAVGGEADLIVITVQRTDRTGRGDGLVGVHDHFDAGRIGAEEGAVVVGDGQGVGAQGVDGGGLRRSPRQDVTVVSRPQVGHVDARRRGGPVEDDTARAGVAGVNEGGLDAGDDVHGNDRKRHVVGLDAGGAEVNVVEGEVVSGTGRVLVDDTDLGGSGAAAVPGFAKKIPVTGGRAGVQHVPDQRSVDGELQDGRVVADD